jgi:hypothetical protein
VVARTLQHMLGMSPSRPTASPVTAPSSLRSVTLLAAMISMLGACAPEPEPMDPGRDDVSYEPFEHGELTLGDRGRARFQLAACAHPEMVEAFPSCALDLPFIVDHRTALLIDWQDGDPTSASVSVEGSAVEIDSSCEQSDWLRIEITAARDGDAVLHLRDAGGSIVDSTMIRVRAAASLELARLDDAGAELGVGERVQLGASLRSEEGELLNAYNELRWRLGDGVGQARLYGTRGWRVELEGAASGEVLLLTAAGAVDASLALSVE